MKSLKIIGILLLMLIIFLTAKVQAITIVLDPGHGGSDPGAVEGEIYEKNITLKIANYLKEYLQEYENVNVILTHDGNLTGELMIFERAMIARNNNADLFISLHINSSTDDSANGAEIYVSANNSLEKYNRKTTELSNKILSKLAMLGISNKGVKTRLIPTDITDIYTDGTRADYYGVIRYAMRGTMIDSGKVTIIQDGQKIEVPETESANVENGEGVPTILIEHCYIRGNDLQYISTDEAIKKIAKADADGIIEYYGLELKSTIDNKIIINNENIKVEPKVTIIDLVKKLSCENYTITNNEGQALKKEIIATGYKLNILKEDNTTIDKAYTLIKAGDVNGDAEVDVIDLALMKRHLMETQKLTGNYYKAGMIQKDGTEIDIIDLALLKRVLMGTTTITF